MSHTCTSCLCHMSNWIQLSRSPFLLCTLARTLDRVHFRGQNCNATRLESLRFAHAIFGLFVTMQPRLKPHKFLRTEYLAHAVQTFQSCKAKDKTIKATNLGQFLDSKEGKSQHSAALCHVVFLYVRV